jgi:hypothetical protein
VRAHDCACHKHIYLSVLCSCWLQNFFGCITCHGCMASATAVHKDFAVRMVVELPLCKQHCWNTQVVTDPVCEI